MQFHPDKSHPIPRYPGFISASPPDLSLSSSETKELIAGYWIWQCASLQEAIEWAKRCPNPMPGPSDIEIRPLYEMEDFGEEFTPELRDQEKRMRDQLEKASKP